MSGSFGEMGNLLKQAQEMQRELDRVREELSKKIVEGTAGGGVVRVHISADRHAIEKVEISEDVLRTADRKLLEDMVLAALQDGLRRAAEVEKQALQKVTGGLNLPGLS